MTEVFVLYSVLALVT